MLASEFFRQRGQHGVGRHFFLRKAFISKATKFLINHDYSSSDIPGSPSDFPPMPAAALDLKEAILQLKKERIAVILAHYYQSGDIQDIADYVGDSLGLAYQAKDTVAANARSTTTF